MKNKGLFIVVDGPSACGKDSIIRQVLEDLKTLGIKSFSIEETKDPSYNRKKILEEKQYGDKSVAEAIINERSKLYRTKVTPQLLAGKVVIANRGETTTLAYQTLRNELTMDQAWNMHRAENIPIPDFVVITKCSVDEAIHRESERLSEAEKDKNFMSGKFTNDDYEKRKDLHASYERVKNFLEEKGISVIYLNTDIMTLPQESKILVDYIKRSYE